MATLNDLLAANSWVVYLVVAALVFAEDAFFVGFVIPGETAAVLGGVAASLGHVHLTLILGLVMAAAVVGDSVGYEVGHRLGPHILQWRLVAPHRDRVARALTYVEARGSRAVFLGRFTAFLRAVVPAVAGMSGMTYRRFLPWNLAGGIIWSTLFLLVGFIAGTSYPAVERTVGRGVMIAVVLVVAAVWIQRRRRR